MIAASGLAFEGDSLVLRVPTFSSLERDWSEEPSPLRVENAPAHVPPVSGIWLPLARGARFVPHLPLLPELGYVARVAGYQARRCPLLAAKAPSVAAVWPPAGVVPANLLRIYLHFDCPPQPGRVLDHVRLLDAKGDEIDAPFLRIGRELWSSDGRRITLLLDPGRVKQGVRPQREAGCALESGMRCILQIDPALAPARGGGRFTQHWRVTAPLRGELNPRRWRLDLPTAGSRDTLRLHAGRALDHGTAGSALGVRSALGEPVPGRARLDAAGHTWCFTPRRPWIDQAFLLTAAPELEDLAGNRADMPFERCASAPLVPSAPYVWLLRPRQGGDAGS